MFYLHTSRETESRHSKGCVCCGVDVNGRGEGESGVGGVCDLMNRYLQTGEQDGPR
jgi:hypothetical protein